MYRKLELPEVMVPLGEIERGENDVIFALVQWYTTEEFCEIQIYSFADGGGVGWGHGGGLKGVDRSHSGWFGGGNDRGNGGGFGGVEGRDVKKGGAYRGHSGIIGLRAGSDRRAGTFPLLN